MKADLVYQSYFLILGENSKTTLNKLKDTEILQERFRPHTFNLYVKEFLEDCYGEVEIVIFDIEWSYA